MSSPSEKKIQFSSTFDIDSKSFHEKITDHKTGETRRVDEEEPHQHHQSTTVTSNPVKYESKGTGEPHVTEGQVFEDIEATKGYDTSQL